MTRNGSDASKGAGEQHFCLVHTSFTPHSLQEKRRKVNIIFFVGRLKKSAKGVSSFSESTA
jgi:hypothetical protein